jgi:hypothetical protein
MADNADSFAPILAVPGFPSADPTASPNFFAVLLLISFMDAFVEDRFDPTKPVLVDFTFLMELVAISCVTIAVATLVRNLFDEKKFGLYVNRGSLCPLIALIATGIIVPQRNYVNR